MTTNDFTQVVEKIAEEHGMVMDSPATQEVLKAITEAHTTAVQEAETNLLARIAEETNKEYSRQEVDNWIFAYGDRMRTLYLERQAALQAQSGGKHE